MNRQSYLIEQIMTIAISGAYAIVMGLMFLNTKFATEGRTLLSIIVPWIQYTVLLSAALLGIMVLFRVIAVLQAAKQLQPFAHEHGNGHDHEHSHDHDHHHHEHDHAHDHGHHHHDHDHGHDHGWSPGRYAVLLFPLLLFLLPFDYDRMISAFEADRIQGRMSGERADFGSSGGAGDALSDLRFLCLSQSPLDRCVAALYCHYGWPLNGGVQAAVDQLGDQVNVDDEPADTVMLENAAANLDQQRYYKKAPRIRIEGIYNPLTSGDRGTLFSVVRLRMACCLNDARPSTVLAVVRKKPNITPGTWVTVKGRIDFYESKEGYKPAMRVAQIAATKQPANPYLK
jgi:hypothetical protein